MAVLTIAGLTLKEAVRRKTLMGAMLLGLLVAGLSLLLILIRTRMEGNIASGRWSPERFALEYPMARSAITMLCLSSIKSLSALFAILLAGGAVSGEIERGLLTVILVRPVHRWQILLGKWIGLNIVLMGSVLVWTTLVWASLTLQTHMDLTPLLKAGLYLSLFPLAVCTLALSFSTFTQRLFGTALALTLLALSWFDGIFNALGKSFQVESMHTIAVAAGLAFPQGYIGWWIDGVTEGIIIRGRRGQTGWESPRFLTESLGPHLHVAHMDAIYLALYLMSVFVIGAVVFHARDVN